METSYDLNTLYARGSYINADTISGQTITTTRIPHVRIDGADGNYTATCVTSTIGEPLTIYTNTGGTWEPLGRLSQVDFAHYVPADFIRWSNSPPEESTFTFSYINWEPEEPEEPDIPSADTDELDNFFESLEVERS